MLWLSWVFVSVQTFLGAAGGACSSLASVMASHWWLLYASTGSKQACDCSTQSSSSYDWWGLEYGLSDWLSGLGAPACGIFPDLHWQVPLSQWTARKSTSNFKLMTWSSLPVWSQLLILMVEKSAVIFASAGEGSYLHWRGVASDVSF